MARSVVPLRRVCLDCSDTPSFPTPQSLEEHWMSSSQHACQFCSAYFKTSAALCYHHGDEHLFCNRCQTRFIITRVLEDHRYISPHHHPCHTCRVTSLHIKYSKSTGLKHLVTIIARTAMSTSMSRRSKESLQTISLLVRPVQSGGS
ncbi:hypothetical protein BDQ17DRAFT_873759 [Cyathus striatus]|nr:hypothetical protein BDQ17DRAFT_873759 [Cyathus striatus]